MQYATLLVFFGFCCSLFFFFLKPSTGSSPPKVAALLEALAQTSVRTRRPYIKSYAVEINGDGLHAAMFWDPLQQ